jgi:tRNA pseudouridine38-40 synthase
VGQGKRPPEWIADLLLAKGDRRLAAPTFSAAGLYLLAVSYQPQWGLPVTDETVYLPLGADLCSTGLAGR